jgi:hypothetical protein
MWKLKGIVDSLGSYWAVLEAKEKEMETAIDNTCK